MTTSINTNFSALTSLQSLSRTNKSLDETLSKVSTGYRVANASDNAAYWSMATTLRSDKNALSAVGDALGLGAATVDVAFTAMNSAIEVVDEFKAKLVAARQPGVDRTKVQTEINALQNQLRSIAESASFSGENWLSVDTSNTNVYAATESVVASFSRTKGTNGDLAQVAKIDIDVASTFLFDVSTTAAADAKGILGSSRLTIANATAANVAGGSIDAAGTIIVASETATGTEIDISNATDSALEDYIQAVDATLLEMTSAATNLGSAKKRIDMQTEFVSSLMDSIDRGVSTLVDADMTIESTKLQALQVQQQLGMQALNIAHGQTQMILSLFR